MIPNLKNILCALAMLSSMSAMAKTTTAPAKSKVVKTTTACRVNADCVGKIELAKESILKYSCVGYVPSKPGVPSKAGKCEFTQMYCDDENSTSKNASVFSEKLCAYIFPDTCSTDSKCFDGNPCTTDSCQNGECLNIGPTECSECSSNDECDTSIKTMCEYVGEEGWARASYTVDLCVPDAGAVNGDGFCLPFYVGQDYCAAGCADGEDMGCFDDVAICDDGEVCTTDSLDIFGNCLNEPVEDYSIDCDDGLRCTFYDTCVAGACEAGYVWDCADGNDCTVDSCLEEGNNYCSRVPTEGSCDDGSQCTSNDVCNSTDGTCAGTLKICNDGVNCTVDSCVANTGACTTQAKNCDDGKPCTTDSCDSATGNCLNAGITDSTTLCSDGNVCTVSDKCVSGVCQGVAKCDDNKPCTLDSCSSAGVCSNVAKVCTDNKSDTTDSCNVVTGECVFAPNTPCPASQVQAGAKNSLTTPVTVHGMYTNVDSGEGSITFAAGATQVKANSGSLYFRPNNVPEWPTLGTAAKLTKCVETGLVCINRCGQEANYQLTATGGDWNSCECAASAAAK